MNWDWDKLQEKRQNQPSWKPVAPGNKNESPGDSRRDETPPPPGGGRASPPGGNGRDPLQALRDMRLPGAKWWLLGVAALWLLSGIYIVQPDEAGVVLRFGRYDRTTTAGPHYHLPFPIEEVYQPKIAKVLQTEVGYRPQSSNATFQQGQVKPVDEEASMLTGDENIITVKFNIQYRIQPDENGPVEYLFNVAAPETVVKKAAEAAMREVIGKTTLDFALTNGRIKIQEDVTALLQEILDQYHMGVQVVAVQMQDVQPPREVRDFFKDVASAREEKQQLASQAEAYRRDLLPKAQGSAAEIINQAEAYSRERVRQAEGGAVRFLAVLEEYNKAPDVTAKRLLYEALEDMLSQPGIDKLVLPSKVGEQVLPFLPLDGLSRKPLSQSPPSSQPAQISGQSPAPKGAN